MGKNSPICFISYCHSDIDRLTVNYLIYIIQQKMKNKVEILYDLNLNIGENLTKFMEKTLAVDVAILLLSPAYKQKVDRREGGVYKEYSLITNRFWIEQDEKKSSNQPNQSSLSFMIAPVIISGSFNESVPDTLQDYLCANLVGFSVIKNKNDKFIITDYIKSRFSKEIDKIIDLLITTYRLKSNSFHIKKEELYDALIINTRTNEQIVKKCPDFFTKVFVPTAPYTNIQAQRSYFLIGRKGTGKSTLATALKLIDMERYNDSITISADSINLDAIYGFLKGQIFSDIKALFPSFTFFNLAWQVFLCLCFIELLEKLDCENKITDLQKTFMYPLKQFLTMFRHSYQSENMRNAFFIFSSQKLQEFYDNCYQEARTTQATGIFLSDINIAVSIDRYLSFVFGEAVISSLKNIVKNCKKRVLVTLDDFNTIFDTFRGGATANDDSQKRAEFEIDWLRSLLLLILDIKDSHFGANSLFQTLDFCITIPKDRYYEIEESERDGYRYGARTSNIDWSGIELCDVLFRRFQKIYNYKGNENLKMHEKLYNIINRVFPALPNDLNFQFNDKKIKIPLFCYILRHTFWRPRDVLMFYTDILAADSSVAKSGYSLTEFAIRRIVSETTIRVIKTEFLDEYRTVVKNIEQIVESFLGKPQVFSFDILVQTIEPIRFILSGTSSTKELIEKIEFLYDIGFLGIVVPNELRADLKLGTKESFYFNEGGSPMRAANKIKFRNIEFAIHPIFSEYLLLTHKNNDFILNFDWDYLYNNHTIKTAILL